MRAKDSNLVQLIEQGFALRQLFEDFVFARQAGQALTLGAPGVQQLLAMPTEDLHVGRTEKAPGRSVSVELGEDIVFGETSAAEDLPCVVRQAARGRAQRFGSQDFDQT